MAEDRSQWGWILDSKHEERVAQCTHATNVINLIPAHNQKISSKVITFSQEYIQQMVSILQ